ncbi:MAG: hypothetical protein QG564_1428 [Campylobacterota bacterium]|nr:hypothetical protein [Campylobacterota bacterium]
MMIWKSYVKQRLSGKRNLRDSMDAYLVFDGVHRSD